MKIISFISTDVLAGRLHQQVIRQILKHLGLWTQMSSRDPPNTNFSPKNHEPVYEIFDDLPLTNILLVKGLYAFNPWQILSRVNTQADDCPCYDESCP